ncbi:MAG: hypothetical protein ACRD0H_02280 [Actinomycetes bacterium]
MSRFQRKPLPESRNPRASRFGAFDFIVDDHDQWWYLETNASGQWGWLAEACDLPMTDAIVADLLAAT